MIKVEEAVHGAGISLIAIVVFLEASGLGASFRIEHAWAYGTAFTAALLGHYAVAWINAASRENAANKDGP